MFSTQELFNEWVKDWDLAPQNYMAHPILAARNNPKTVVIHLAFNATVKKSVRPVHSSLFYSFADIHYYHWSYSEFLPILNQEEQHFWNNFFAWPPHWICMTLSDFHMWFHCILII